MGLFVRCKMSLFPCFLCLRPYSRNLLFSALSFVFVCLTISFMLTVISVLFSYFIIFHLTSSPFLFPSTTSPPHCLASSHAQYSFTFHPLSFSRCLFAAFNLSMDPVLFSFFFVISSLLSLLPPPDFFIFIYRKCRSVWRSWSRRCQEELQQLWHWSSTTSSISPMLVWTHAHKVQLSVCLYLKWLQM